MQKKKFPIPSVIFLKFQVLIYLCIYFAQIISKKAIKRLALKNHFVKSNYFWHWNLCLGPYENFGWLGKISKKNWKIFDASTVHNFGSKIETLHICIQIIFRNAAILKMSAKKKITFENNQKTIERLVLENM